MATPVHPGEVWVRMRPGGTDRRLVLEVTPRLVFYRNLVEESDGTCVEVYAMDLEHQVGIRQWNKWARHAVCEVPRGA